jgi:acylphosphatase
LEVTGYVQNLPDGRVHVVAEGESAEVAAFFQKLEDHMAPYIRDVRKDQTAATGEFAAFDVRY